MTLYIKNILEDFVNFVNTENNQKINKNVITNFLLSLNNDHIEPVSIFEALSDSKNICKFVNKHELHVCSKISPLYYDNNNDIFLCSEHYPMREKNHLFEKGRDKEYFKCELFFGDKQFDNEKYTVL